MYMFNWEAHAQHQSNLVAICRQHQQDQRTSGVAATVKSGLYESDFDFLLDPNSSTAALLQWGRSCLFEAAKHANQNRWPPGARIGVNIHESWCHITQNGGYHDMHIHPNSAWSAIYYVDAGDSDVETRSGLNRFYAPWTVAYSDISTRYCSEVSSIDIQPQDGSLVVFPSWLPHAATPYQGTRPRVVIAFNAVFIDGGRSE
jgi:hypothetical protein